MNFICYCHQYTYTKHAGFMEYIPTSNFILFLPVLLNLLRSSCPASSIAWSFYQATELHWSLLSYKISIIKTATPNLQFQLLKTSMGVDIIFPFLEEGRQDS